ncbi:hypothetical protein H8E77_07380 [bacterium]|nr:hypothetical protein [bacterium]
MSTKISLYFIERIMPDYADLDISAIRLCCDVAFRTASGITAPYRAIIDTGAPLSLLPLYVWKQCKVKKIRDSAIRGVVPRPECILPVTLADITCMLVDGRNKTSELPIKAQLAHTDEVPLVIGFRDLLDNVELYIDYKREAAYLTL